MNIQFTIKTLASVLVLACLLACNSSDKSKGSGQSTDDTTDLTETSASNKGQAFIEDNDGDPNALQLAMGSEDHTTLVTAVQAAGVENALVNVGPLTIFAPTNAAFDKLDKATLEDLFKPENKSKLANILVHHVAPSNYPVKTLEKNIEKDRKLYMADGSYLEVTKKGEDLYIGDAKIMASIHVSNGWVHIIDNVLLPNN
ncbi:fasciclin domain-containing protein [Psychroflexus sediminis]|uniref:Uncaracterized surface protein containing fasciclin (FAS1) repeats n=1 Tax=Psychroflexus sediminis TaxID=470826 RepID=A0A1G7ZFD5_9FLAO|nr:fasciclin domain-containing protein [Psychroflexus sediminis]SDH07335.1 Uncaracterized surface protein containing fasciclin (FAS1) repeats [Psychroflexus sediminis]